MLTCRDLSEFFFKLLQVEFFHLKKVVGIISRKDLAKYRCWRHAASMGLKELRIR